MPILAHTLHDFTNGASLARRVTVNRALTELLIERRSDVSQSRLQFGASGEQSSPKWEIPCQDADQPPCKI